MREFENEKTKSFVFFRVIYNIGHNFSKLLSGSENLQASIIQENKSSDIPNNEDQISVINENDNIVEVD